MTRAEIIAQLDAELFRLERARDYLTSALKSSKSRFFGKLDITLVQKVKRQQRPRPAKLVVAPPQPELVPAIPVPAVAAEPLVKRVPPRRRAERRPAQADKALRSTAALSGAVPAGPVVVSANEARKHERTGPAPVLPMVTELRSEIGAERSLGSLIQAFERQTGFNGAETP